MKVVQINGVSSAGSTGKIVSQLSEVMTMRGIENYIISSGYKEKKKPKNVFFCSSFIGVKIHQFFGILFGNSGFHSYFATRKAINIIRTINPDIVQLHNIYSYFINVETLLKYLKKYNFNVVWTMHDFWSITGHCTHFESIGCDKWKIECHNCPQKSSFPYSKFLDRSKELYSNKKNILENWNKLQIVAVSEWVKAVAELSYFKRKKISVISNGVDLNTFFPETIERPMKYKDKFILLSVSMGWGEKKGYYEFLELSKRLRNDELIILVGLNEEQLKKLPKNIIGYKRTSSIEELRYLYNLADVYISASVEETMGLTVAEAMACGTPAIVYNKTALPELIRGNCGYVCEEGVCNLIEKINLIRVNCKKNYLYECTSNVKNNYDKMEQYKKYCELYENIIR